ncbi:MAG: hypothetical protein NC225_03185 [Clostridium sp.]|nr:hypothetical protein [Clostridium sp.]MCM1398469.1 hypothetical protein [Clostridium sp.]MCM1460191.1 hypothetical protein [Bacteroides sp.]
MEWEELWKKLLNKGIGKKINEMDVMDKANGNAVSMEDICHNIFADYNQIKPELKATKKEILDMMENLPGVHLHTSRVKSVESLIEKIITKRYQRMFDKESGYADISAETYKNVVTDLVGLRIIINYRGHWLEMHKQILEKFPYDKTQKYQKGVLIPVEKGLNIQAEIPKVYYAVGDNVDAYIKEGLITKQHTMNYRSIHYTVTYNGFYVEIQMRTIYDEAWSDCDHNYVYKKDDNKSHEALKNLSSILSKLTNLSNDIGEKMKDIYDEQLIEKHSEGWRCSEELIHELDEMSKRMINISDDINTFKSKIAVKKRE